ncbi:hypothetical protein Metvu_0565 [Methanocaldococcus vulcanius M7]|uniref:Uncharacterized protein n=1 Tax=Methanocaldococcus vulcanius (strain ATCC 700851 / DSM 12094 / M7) TaxID=579137 RepID=C9RFS2_METVM|nr:carboxypeptidase-like regulatory domain-containing protein [Methanocaldococcus vulcanius]ACX72424.1 hypothetical protein Metvu_0565 [Methanocaldococcus vulcanius M7]
MDISKLGKTVFLNDFVGLAVFSKGSIWTVTVTNYEADDTGADGGNGVGLRYIDVNGNKVDVRVPNNGSLTFECLVGDNGYLCEVYAIYWDIDYEDKHVDVSAVDIANSTEITFPTVHIGDNVAEAELSHTYTVPSPDVFSSGTVTVDWGDGTIETANLYRDSNGNLISDKRWCYAVIDNTTAGIFVAHSHTYDEPGSYKVMIKYSLGQLTFIRFVDVEIPSDVPSARDYPDLNDDAPDSSPPLDPNLPDIPDDNNDLNNFDFTTTPSLQIAEVETDKEEYSWRVDGNAIINIKVIDNNQIPVDGCLISPVATSLGNGQYQITYPLPQVDDTVEVEITAQKSGYEPASTTVSLRVSEWGNYVLKASVLTDKDKYLYASTEPAKITVIVEDKAGNRVSGCTITDNFGNSYTDNGNGEYTAYMDISNLPVGRYDLVVKATKDNYKSNINDRTPQTEQFVYDGVNSSFKLKYKLIEPISVKINGTETTNYTITNDAYGDCYLNILDSMNASDIVEITYNYYTDSTYFDIAESLEPITVIVVDEQSIAKYGKRLMETLYIPSLQTVEEAEQIGRDYLAQYANPRPVWEIETYLDLIPPKIGDIVFTNDKFWNIIQKRVNYVEFSIKPNDKRVKLGLEYEKELLIDILESIKG